MLWKDNNVTPQITLDGGIIWGDISDNTIPMKQNRWHNFEIFCTHEDIINMRVDKDITVEYLLGYQANQ